MDHNLEVQIILDDLLDKFRGGEDPDTFNYLRRFSEDYLELCSQCALLRGLTYLRAGKIVTQSPYYQSLSDISDALLALCESSVVINETYHSLQTLQHKTAITATINDLKEAECRPALRTEFFNVEHLATCNISNDKLHSFLKIGFVEIHQRCSVIKQSMQTLRRNQVFEMIQRNLVAHNQAHHYNLCLRIITKVYNDAVRFIKEYDEFIIMLFSRKDDR